MYIYVYITWYFLASPGWRFFSWLKAAETGDLMGIGSRPRHPSLLLVHGAELGFREHLAIDRDHWERC